MVLEEKAQYEGIIILSGLQSMATNNQVKSKLAALGFTNVIVVGAGNKRTARGIWASPTQEFTVPSVIQNIRKL